MIPLEVPLLYRIVLAILDFLLFCMKMKFSIVLSRSVKNFDGHYIEYVDRLQ